MKMNKKGRNIYEEHRKKIVCQATHASRATTNRHGISGKRETLHRGRYVLMLISNIDNIRTAFSSLLKTLETNM